MNILILGLGGVTASFRNWPERIVALALARRGHHVRAIGTHDPARPALAARRETIEGVDVQRVRSAYWPNRELAAALEAGPRPDIMHLMHPRNVLADQASRWAKKHGIPIVYTWLGPYHDAYLIADRERPFDHTPRYANLIWTRGQLARRLLGARGPRAARDMVRNYRLHAPLKRADHLMPCSQFEADEMRRMGLTQPQTVVPLWIEAGGAAATVPELAATRPWLLFVGQLTPRKGYDLALRAMPGILARHPSATLLMVSGINHAERAEVERLTEELGITERVRFLGRVEDSDLQGLFGACDAYLTPTRYEGFGLTMLEAMAAGAPIVASNIPVVDEIIKQRENGLLAAYDDAEDLGRQVLALLEEPGLAERLRAGGRRAWQLWYNPDDLAQQIEQAYTQILDD